MNKGKITNKDVLEFYADKGTGELIKKCRRPTGDYAGLANTFISKGTEGENGDICFYNWLKEQEKQNFSKTLSLAKVAEKDESFKDFILNPVLEDPLIEKWHLYVSWYALEEYWGGKKLEEVPWNNKNKKKSVKKQWLIDTINEPATTDASGILKSSVSCCRLLLWMYEASEPDMESELYKKAEDAVCNGSLTGLISFFKEEIEKKIKKWKESCTEQDN